MTGREYGEGAYAKNVSRRSLENLGKCHKF